MSGLLGAVVALLVRGLHDLMPADKAEWARAMGREIEEMESAGQAFLFALGCAWAALKERMRTMETMTRLGRMLVPAVMLALGGVTSLSARRLMPVNEAVGMTFALLAAAFLIGGLLTILRGPRALIAAASAMLGLHLFVLAWMLAAPASLPGGPPEPIQRALLTEGLAIWTLLLAAGAFLAAASRALATAKGRD